MDIGSTLARAQMALVGESRKDMTMEIVGDYERDGAVRVRGAFDPEMVEAASNAIDAVLRDPSPLVKRASAAGDGAFIEDFCNWTRVPAMRRFVERSPGAVIAAQLMGTKTVRLYHDHVLVKEPNTSQRTPWHQDLPYYNVEGMMNASMWMPVDPVPRSSTLEFIAGSHLGPWYMPRTFLDGQAKWFPEGALDELPDPDHMATIGETIGWELEPGDAVFFHMLTLHSAAGVANQRRRVNPPVRCRRNLIRSRIRFRKLARRRSSIRSPVCTIKVRPMRCRTRCLSSTAVQKTRSTTSIRKNIAFRVLGVPLGILVQMMDISKGLIAVLFVSNFFYLKKIRHKQNC